MIIVPAVLPGILDVLPGLTPEEEPLVALDTLPRFDIVVSVHVIGQVILSRKRFKADSTGECLDSCMSLCVSDQITFVVKLTVTVITVEVSNAEMSGLVSF